MAYNMGGRRFRPVGSGKKRTAPQYGPVGTGCPFVEEAVARLYREQSEEHFWSLMNALNYALELQTKVLVPLDLTLAGSTAEQVAEGIAAYYKDAATVKVHALNEALPDPQLSAAMTRMEKAGRSIVETVEATPAKAKQVRRFANYYLPDAVNVLQQYAKLAKQGVRGENAASIRAEVEHNAASIATAFENQLDALYAAESMDLSADLTVLQNMLKGQGL